jgi:hypothetical protein
MSLEGTKRHCLRNHDGARDAKKGNDSTGCVAHACNPSYLGGGGRRILSLRTAQTKLVRPYLKNKRSGSVAQVVEHLPSKCEALSSNPTLHIKKEWQNHEIYRGDFRN